MYQNFYYSIFIWSSTCFGRHTTHHQEPKTALAASGFSYVEGRWTLVDVVRHSMRSCSDYTFSYCAWQRPPSTRPTNLYVRKARGCQCSFRLLMMGGLLPETCWASFKYGIIKILIHCCILLDFLYELCNDARIHEHQTRFIIPFILVHFVDYTSGKPQLTPQTLHYRNSNILSRFLLLAEY